MPKKDNPYNLTDRQIAFADAYLSNGCSNAYKAALEVGYSENYADRQGYKLLGIVGDYLKEKREPLIEETEYTQKEMLSRYDEAYQLGKKSKNASTIIKATDSIVKMLGLEQPKKVDVTTGGETMNFGKLSVEELALYAELEAKRNAE